MLMGAYEVALACVDRRAQVLVGDLVAAVRVDGVERSLPEGKVPDGEIGGAGRVLDDGEALADLARDHLLAEAVGERLDPALHEVRHGLLDLAELELGSRRVARVEVRVDRRVVRALEVLVVGDRRRAGERDLLRKRGVGVAVPLEMHPEVAVIHDLLGAALGKEAPDDRGVRSQGERRVVRRHLGAELTEPVAHDVAAHRAVRRVVDGPPELAHRVRRAGHRAQQETRGGDAQCWPYKGGKRQS